MNERAFLGLLIESPKHFEQVYQSGNIFFDGYCRKLFDLMGSLFDSGIAITSKTIENTNSGYFEDEINELRMIADPYDSFEHRFDFLKKHFIHRSVQYTVANYNDKYKTAENFQTALESAIYLNSDKIEDMADIKQLHIELMQKERMPKTLTGLNFFDINGGIRNQHLVIIGARPKTGKTSFAVHLIARAVEKNYPVAFFSLEIDRIDFNAKFLSNLSRVDSNLIFDKKLTSIQEMEVARKMDETKDKKLFVISNNMNVNQICRGIKKLHKSHGVKIFFVDHLHHIKRPAGKSQIEQLEYITRKLMETKKELGVIIYLLAQLNRDAENNTPKISDLKGCGDIEQLADLIILLHEREKINLVKSNLDLYITNRFGPGGRIHTVFDKDISRIEEINNLTFRGDN